MNRRDMRILIVTEDGPETARLIAHLATNLNADFVHVDSIFDARNTLTKGEYDAIIAGHCLCDGSGMDLLGEDSPATAPVILVEDEMIPERLVAALRSGAADVIGTPVDCDYLVRCLYRVVRHYRTGKHEGIRSKRLRRLSSRLVKDRRELRKRVDLICNDIVSAYQRLAEKVVAVIEPGELADDVPDEYPLRTSDDI